jgi:hypothetical protein
VQVNHVGGAGPLVQVVDVGGDDVHVEVVLQRGQPVVRGVGFGGRDLSAALVVEVEDQAGMCTPAVF